MTRHYRPTPSQVRLQAALEREFKDATTYVELERRLRSAVSGESESESSGELEKTIDRRKLRRLAASDEDVPITFSELHTLDVFLRRRGHGGLSSIFRSTDLLQSISELPTTTFFLGFQPASSPEARTWISHWDLCSVTELLHGLYRFHYASRLKVKLEEVQLREHPTVEQMSDESWYELIKSEQTSQSLISIGSPKACHASEVMLAEMFGVKPFESGGTEPRQDLPFQFEWTMEQLERTPSSFAFARTSAKSLPAPFRNFSSFSLHYLGVCYEVPMEEKQWRDYGVIVAQRRGNGNIWAVCAGLSGPATLASARMLASEQIDLAPLRRNQPHSDPVVCIVEADVKQDSTPSQGDRRKVLRERFRREPAVVRAGSTGTGGSSPLKPATPDRDTTA